MNKEEDKKQEENNKNMASDRVSFYILFSYIYTD